MRVLLQRVSSARVEIEEKIHGQIRQGFLLLVGVEEADTQSDIDWLAGKITRMRLFADDEGKMNRSLLDIRGELLVISQFTLYASTKKGNRPSFLGSAPPEIAEKIYEDFCTRLSEEIGKPVATGKFGADMQVHLTNDGPVTIWIDSRDRR